MDGGDEVGQRLADAGGGLDQQVFARLSARATPRSIATCWGRCS